LRLKPSHGSRHAFLLQEEKLTFAQELLEYTNISITLAYTPANEFWKIRLHF